MEEEPVCTDLSDDKRLLLTAESYNAIRIYDVSSGEKVWEYFETEEVRQLKWLVTGCSIAIETVSNFKTLQLLLNFNKY